MCPPSSTETGSSSWRASLASHVSATVSESTWPTTPECDWEAELGQLREPSTPPSIADSASSSSPQPLSRPQQHSHDSITRPRHPAASLLSLVSRVGAAAEAILLSRESDRFVEWLQYSVVASGLLGERGMGMGFSPVGPAPERAGRDPLLAVAALLAAAVAASWLAQRGSLLFLSMALLTLAVRSAARRRKLRQTRSRVISATSDLVAAMGGWSSSETDAIAILTDADTARAASSDETPLRLASWRATLESQHRRLLTGLVAVLKELRRHAPNHDFDTLLDAHQIAAADIREALLSAERAAEDPETDSSLHVSKLQLSGRRVATVRRMLLCAILVVPAKDDLGLENDRWLSVARAIEQITAEFETASKELAEVVEGDDGAQRSGQRAPKTSQPSLSISTAPVLTNSPHALVGPLSELARRLRATTALVSLLREGALAMAGSANQSDATLLSQYDALGEDLRDLVTFHATSAHVRQDRRRSSGYFRHVRGSSQSPVVSLASLAEQAATKAKRRSIGPFGLEIKTGGLQGLQMPLHTLTSVTNTPTRRFPSVSVKESMPEVLENEEDEPAKGTDGESVGGGSANAEAGYISWKQDQDGEAEPDDSLERRIRPSQPGPMLASLEALLGGRHGGVLAEAENTPVHDAGPGAPHRDVGLPMRKGSPRSVVQSDAGAECVLDVLPEGAEEDGDEDEDENDDPDAVQPSATFSLFLRQIEANKAACPVQVID